ncbi:hypothetical protein SLEP1_g11217 [Rubroshorea leprosula]|uniref:Uncharacterized protein n=1 Tax=Rubroshorea leprosula TaxID=152421 RepID=A0AAV5IAM2_9ROSI|nr:hypothetical protein SLEP1_g11217 [Rubroshorea leprosula]
MKTFNSNNPERKMLYSADCAMPSSVYLSSSNVSGRSNPISIDQGFPSRNARADTSRLSPSKSTYPPSLASRDDMESCVHSVDIIQEHIQLPKKTQKLQYFGIQSWGFSLLRPEVPALHKFLEQNFSILGRAQRRGQLPVFAPSDPHQNQLSS